VPDRVSVEIHVNNLGGWPVQEDRLAQACRTVFVEEEVSEGEVSVTLMGDEAIQAMNLEYFDKDWPTDVIAFSLHGADEPVLGDVYLGYQQARRQADELGISLGEERLRLVIHGTLHVIGYEHPERDGRFECDMYRKQEALLESLSRT